jgi:hypothetical protein
MTLSNQKELDKARGDKEAWWRDYDWEAYTLVTISGCPRGQRIRVPRELIENDTI